MLWAIAVVLIILWMLGLVTDYDMGSFIHGLYVIAVVLLLISINREVNVYRGLRRMVRSRNYKRVNSGGEQRGEHHAVASVNSRPGMVV